MEWQNWSGSHIMFPQLYNYGTIIFFNLSFKDKTIYWEQVWMINSLCIHSGNKQVYLGHMYLEFVQLEVVQINFYLKCNVC